MDISHDVCINISHPPVHAISSYLCPGLVVVVVVVGLCPVFTRLCVAPPCSCLTAALLTQIGAAWTEGKLEQDGVNLVISQ